MAQVVKRRIKIYGPYTRKDGRKHIILWDGICRQTISYPKWLMQEYLGRKLTVDETVDHINRDFTDDRIENLQILDRKKHIILDIKRAVPVMCKCVWCGNLTVKKQSNMKGNSRKGKAGPFCSKACIGAYGAELQNSRIKRFPVQAIPEYHYYQLEK